MNTGSAWSDELAAHEEDIDTGDVAKSMLVLLL